MNLLKRTALAAVLFVAACAPALAQWQTPNHSVPVGRGSGATGFKSAVPGATGGVLTSNGASADPTFKPLSGPLYASSFGVVCDGTTDNAAAYVAIMAAFPATGGTLIMPAGICMGVMDATKPVIVQGQGMRYGGAPAGVPSTELRSSGAADNVLTFSDNGGGARDLSITSSVAAASRSGAGLKIGPKQGIEIRNVSSVGHKYGFWNTAPGNIFNQAYAFHNNTYGLYLDGNAFGQSEVEIYYSQFNENQHGVGIGGAGTGIFTTRLTAANNSQNGIYFEPGSTINDVYFTQPEISTNGAHGVDALNNTGINLEFDAGGVIEVQTGGGNAIRSGVGQGGLMVRNTWVTGGLTAGVGNVVINFAGPNTIIAGNQVYSAGAGTFAINAEATASNFNVFGNTVTAQGSGQTAMLINSGATLGRFCNNMLSAYAANIANLSTSATNVTSCNNSSSTGNQETQSGVTAAVTTSTAYGSLFTGTLAVTFAKPFTSAPKIAASPASASGGSVSCFSDGTTAAGFTLRGIGTTSGGAFTCNYVASQQAF